MKDVARSAGVSLMTVSRVVNGDRGVSVETTARVERAVARLGYQRNDIAAHLRTKAQTTRYLVLVGSTNDDPRREREVVLAFAARQVDGLIVVPTAGSHAFLKAQMAQGMPVVAADRPARGLEVDTVTVDNRDAARRAVAHLLAHRHRRIAYLGDQRDIWTLRERFAGYQDALHSHDVAPDPSLVRHGLRSRTEAADAVAGLMRGPAPPTALFSSNDLITVGAIDGLGTPAPRVALVGFDDFPLADKLARPVTVVSQDPATIGGTAAQLLFSRIDGYHAPARSVVLLTRFIVRGSGEIPPP
jgi:LacI family transcriptional regulator